MCVYVYMHTHAHAYLSMYVQIHLPVCFHVSGSQRTTWHVFLNLSIIMCMIERCMDVYHVYA